jgi:predicted DNA-binding protein with PD1-like motif
MKWKKIEDCYLIKPGIGEDVVEAILALVKELGLGSGSACGIGGVEDVVLGYYDLEARTYKKRELSGRYELVSLVGNVSIVEGEPFVHAHAVVSGPDMAALGGHLFGAKVAVTAEIYLWGSATPLTRSLDERVGLNTLDLQG